MRYLGFLVAISACWWSEALGVWFFWFVLLGLLMANRKEAMTRRTWAQSCVALGVLGLVFAAAPAARSGLLNDPGEQAERAPDVELVSFTGPFTLTGERLMTITRSDGTSTEYRDAMWLFLALNLLEPFAAVVVSVLLLWLTWPELRAEFAGITSARPVIGPPSSVH